MLTREKKMAHVNLGTMTRPAIFASIFIVLAQFYIPLPVTLVPVTLQTLGIMLCAVLLPLFEAVCAVGLYVLMGAIGLPVFSGFAGGIGVLAGPTGGFIIGFLPAVWLMSLVLNTKWTANQKRFVRYLLLIIAMLMFTVVVYGFGLVWFMISLGKSFHTALAACALPFLPGDALKCVAIVLFYPVLTRMKPALYSAYQR